MEKKKQAKSAKETARAPDKLAGAARTSTDTTPCRWKSHPHTFPLSGSVALSQLYFIALFIQFKMSIITFMPNPSPTKIIHGTLKRIN